jgi:Uma2 family endonuclease
MPPSPPPEIETFADLLERIGDVPLDRILMRPAPGTATEEDAIALLEAMNKRLVELVEGVLVEKAVGTRESLIAVIIGSRLMTFLEQHDLGVVLGADGAMRLRQGLIRIPDVSFIRWEQWPNGVPDEPLARVAPDLAVEVLSESNTKKEMQRKLRDYFLAGVQVVWFIDPKTETAEVYTAPDKKRRVGKEGALSGGSLLPGFSLSLPELFARCRRKPRPSRGTPPKSGERRS